MEELKKNFSLICFIVSFSDSWITFYSQSTDNGYDFLFLVSQEVNQPVAWVKRIKMLSQTSCLAKWNVEMKNDLRARDDRKFEAARKGWRRIPDWVPFEVCKL